jgi:hypothetical protein
VDVLLGAEELVVVVVVLLAGVVLLAVVGSVEAEDVPVLVVLELAVLVALPGCICSLP